MKALVRTAAGLRCLEKPVPGVEKSGDVLIKVSRAAICRTDVFAAQGLIPVADGRVLGHEFTGVVEATGADVSRIKTGDRVVVNPLLPCGACADCAQGRPHECANAGFLGLHQDGAFAQKIVVPESQVHGLQDYVDDAIGAYAEPLAATMAVLDAGLPPHGKIAVTGRGRIAELTHFVLEDHGYSTEKVAVPAGRAGEFDAVVETDLCSANAEDILGMLRPGGLLVLKSRMPALLALPPLLCITRRLRVQAVHYAEFERALRYVGQWTQKLAGFVGSEWSLEDHDQAFSAACADEAQKIYFKPNG
ncbi:zinc-binding dehydrogenase [Prosthecobacter sp.]|uniref:zinc-binding dehydrogenase n=1 Tax=Prosthecobacter sp. TaxID=1965333 RepID=UPI0037851265